MRLLARIAVTVVFLLFIPVTASAAAISDVEPAAAEAGFEDVPADHLFSDAVSWLADQGITKGCNPPKNDRFCPDDPVTRGQMAAFLHRAFDTPAVGEPGVNRPDPKVTTVLGTQDVAWTAEGILDALGSALGVKAGAKISASGHPQIVVGTRVMGAGG